MDLDRGPNPRGVRRLAALEAIAQRLHPNSRLRRTFTLRGGISASMTVLEITGPTGETRRVVLRIPSEDVLANRPSAAADEFETIKALDATGVRVPEPLLLDESLEILPTPYLVLRYVEGNPDYDPRDRLTYERQRAEGLARIHAVDISLPDLASLRRPPHAFASQLQDRSPDPDSPVDEGRIHTALQRFWTLPPGNPPVLLHGDLWPGNLLWKDETLVAVLDWEDASLGDPLADLAICRLDSLLIFSRDAMEVFTDAYLSLTGINTEHLPYWDLCAALRAAPAIATWAAYFPSLGRPDITDESMRANLHTFAMGALSRVLDTT